MHVYVYDRSSYFVDSSFTQFDLPPSHTNHAPVIGHILPSPSPTPDERCHTPSYGTNIGLFPPSISQEDESAQLRRELRELMSKAEAGEAVDETRLSYLLDHVTLTETGTNTLSITPTTAPSSQAGSLKNWSPPSDVDLTRYPLAPVAEDALSRGKGESRGEGGKQGQVEDDFALALRLQEESDRQMAQDFELAELTRHHQQQGQPVRQGPIISNNNGGSRQADCVGNSRPGETSSEDKKGGNCLVM